MYTAIKNNIIALAEQSPDAEICGILYYNGVVSMYPCENKAVDKKYNFVIDPQELLKIEQMGQIIGLYHSHTEGTSTFSDSDRQLVEELLLPLWVYSLNDKGFRELRPKTNGISLEGRKWQIGLWDCYAIVRDYFWQKFNIDMNDYDRDESFLTSDSTVIIDNFAKENFHSVECKMELKKHDVLLFKQHRMYPHHFAVFIGNSRVIQHCRGRLSGIDLLKGPQNITHVLRYNDPTKL